MIDLILSLKYQNVSDILNGFILEDDIFKAQGLILKEQTNILVRLLNPFSKIFL